MIPKKLLVMYDFHDSLIKKIDYNDSLKILDIHLDFCAWMQKGYNPSTPETQHVVLHFTGVHEYQGFTGVIDDYSILETSIKDGIIHFFVLDDFHDKEFHLYIYANDVEFKESTNKN